MKRTAIIILMFLPLLSEIHGQDISRDGIIQRYMSVSYPLAQIRVTSGFGYRTDPFTGKKSWHSGVDLRAHADHVHAMMDGMVTKTGEDSRSGKFVILNHGTFQISYCHLSRISVKEGDEVLAGDTVAVTGNTGRSTGEHLHITCRFRGETVDPMVVIRYVRRVHEECLSSVMDSERPVK